MSFSAYRDYRESHVAWLGEIPAHWGVTRFCDLGIQTGGGTPPRDQVCYWNGSIPWVSPKDMKTEVVNTTFEGITEGGVKNSSVAMIDSGSLLIVCRSGILQHTLPVAINSVPVTINQDMRALTPTETTSVQYLLRVFQGLNGNLLIALRREGATVESIDGYLLNKLQLPLPPCTEQIAIAAFLDHETGKIDSLVAEQERLIVLLDEKRQAIISHAVAKGLDPNVEMKDSGIEWMGEVPAHWTIARIHEAAHLMNGYPFDSNKFSQDAGHPLVRIRDLDCKHTALLYDGDFIDAAKVDGNDLLIGMDGDFNVGRWRGQGEALLNQRVCCLRGDVAIIRWLEYVIPYPLKLINDITYSTTVKHLSSGQVRDIRIPLPRGNEMGVLLDHLDKAVGLLDNLSKTAKEGILLLKERRSALISAAVTGKIDVRNHQAAVAALNEDRD